MSSLFRGLRHLIVGLAAVLAMGVPLWFAAAGQGTKYGLWDYGFGLITMTFNIGPMLLFAALGMGVLALVLLIVYRFFFGAANAPGMGGWVAAVCSILVGAGGDAPKLYFMNTKTRQAHPSFMRDLGIAGGFGGFLRNAGGCGLAHRISPPLGSGCS